jgi:hypothetical protein
MGTIRPQRLDWLIVRNERHLYADRGQNQGGRALSEIPSRLRANGVDSWFTRLRGRGRRAPERLDHGRTRPAKGVRVTRPLRWRHES